MQLISVIYTLELDNESAHMYIAARIAQLQHVMKIDGASKGVAKKESETLQKKKLEDTQSVVSIQAVCWKKLLRFICLFNIRLTVDVYIPLLRFRISVI